MFSQPYTNLQKRYLTLCNTNYLKKHTPSHVITVPYTKIVKIDKCSLSKWRINTLCDGTQNICIPPAIGTLRSQVTVVNALVTYPDWGKHQNPRMAQNHNMSPRSCGYDILFQYIVIHSLDQQIRVRNRMILYHFLYQLLELY